MKAVIIAGGKGTRMGDISKEIPKPMIQIGSKPILEHQINILKRYGISEIILITGHLSNVIEEYFKDGKEFGVNIEYYTETIPLGTTGGLKEIENKLVEDFLVLYGDIMFDININKLIQFHNQKSSKCTLVIHPNDHPHDSDLLEVNEEGRIIAFHPKPHQNKTYYNNLVNAGIYIFSTEIFKHIKKGKKEDFGKDIFPRLPQSLLVYGYNTAEYLKDMGTKERFDEVKKDLENGKIKRLNAQNKRGAIFIDRDGTINVKKDHIYDINEFELIPGVSEAIRKINHTELLAILITNQPVVARGLCSIKELEEIHKKMESMLGQNGAKFDAIYYCPHHPDKGYQGENITYKVRCNCRKPDIGLLLKAKEYFNIDFKKSFFVGDSLRDISCGKNAGIKTVGVKTGEGCINGKPDYLFPDLNAAVNFIIQISNS
ncbi:D,D-heptose 1,7-bisphosphate phosphatase [Candidatus Woesearchaeota archaeon CG_4_10_14_0_2_um_filter_33_13]|nr:MAG: D,D-heptose 1,7-bisphosphate phosphatase [Candidatus Woesearchaeota archaeon CG_4_10_14_0_2_um_filter_33_13]